MNMIYHFELSLEQGFDVLDKEEKEDRLYRGKRVSACSGWPLFKTMRGQPIRCWSCGCEADRWIGDQGRRNHMAFPVVNLYGLREGKITLMNRDHIIPKSLGGLDMNANLRPACEYCNGGRGNLPTPEEIEFRKNNPHLWSRKRLEDGKAGARKRLLVEQNPEARELLKLPFALIGEPL